MPQLKNATYTEGQQVAAHVKASSSRLDSAIDRMDEHVEARGDAGGSIMSHIGQLIPELAGMAGAALGGMFGRPVIGAGLGNAAGDAIKGLIDHFF